MMSETESCVGCGKDLNDDNCSSLDIDSERHLCDECFNLPNDEVDKLIDKRFGISEIKKCIKCGDDLIIGDNWSLGMRKAYNNMCKKCQNEKSRLWCEENREKYLARATRYRRNRGVLPMSENKDCSSYLGVHVTEKMIMKYFKDAIQMRYGNQGYDMVCNRGKLIEIKSSCLRKSGGWMFNIKQNNTADHFVLVAYGNRKYLDIMHVWLIPGKALSHLTGAGISPSTVERWSEYEQDVTEMIACCNAMKDAN